MPGRKRGIGVGSAQGVLVKLIDMGVLPCGSRMQYKSRKRAARRTAQPLPLYCKPSRRPQAGRMAHAPARFAQRMTLAGVVLGWAIFGGLDRLAGFMPGPSGHLQLAQAVADTPGGAVWAVDEDGDGVIDFANPTHGLIRGVDAYGSGTFGAVRDGGKRKHHGVDYVVAPGDWVEAPIAGTITRYGYAYRRDKDFRYVEIRNEETGMRARVLYVDASVADGAVVAAGEIIGTAQDLAERYPHGITNHVHVELTDQKGALLDPATLLPLGEADRYASASHRLATRQPS